MLQFVSEQFLELLGTIVEGIKVMSIGDQNLLNTYCVLVACKCMCVYAYVNISLSQ